MTDSLQRMLRCAADSYQHSTKYRLEIQTPNTVYLESELQAWSQVGACGQTLHSKDIGLWRLPAQQPFPGVQVLYEQKRVHYRQTTTLAQTVALIKVRCHLP